jgi:plastocyanin
VSSWAKAAFVPAVVVTVAVSVTAVAAAVNDDGGSAASAAAPADAPSDTAAAGIADFAFSPDPLTVKVGQIVTWTNRDRFAHTVKAKDGSFDSGDLAQGGAFSTTFDAPGPHAYICGIHNSMTGTVVVQP